MRDRVTIWGNNEKKERVLLAIELIEEAHQAIICTFLKDQLNKEQIAWLENFWVDGDNDNWDSLKIEQRVERDFSNSYLLPDELKVDDPSVIKKTESAWQYRILTRKLFQMLKQDIDAVGNRIKEESANTKVLWQDAKDLWEKVKENYIEKNLNKEQTKQLRESLNEMFAALKEKKQAAFSAAIEDSKEDFEKFKHEILAIKEKINPENKLNELFKGLQEVQQKVHQQKLASPHYQELKALFNDSFNQIKALKKEHYLSKIDRRVAGLTEAIEKMKQSIARDEASLEFQNKKMSHNNATQLEAKLRQVKLDMIEERIKSKKKKLKEMLKTLDELKGAHSSS